MRFKNTSDKPVKLSHLGVAGIGPIGPGEEVELPDELGQPGLRGYAQRRPSVIESLAPQLVPADPDEHLAWLEAPEPLAPVSRVVTADRMGGRAPAPAPVAPGVAAARAAAKVAAPAAKKE